MGISEQAQIDSCQISSSSQWRRRRRRRLLEEPRTGSDPWRNSGQLESGRRGTRHFQNQESSVCHRSGHYDSTNRRSHPGGTETTITTTTIKNIYNGKKEKRKR